MQPTMKGIIFLCVQLISAAYAHKCIHDELHPNVEILESPQGYGEAHPHRVTAAAGYKDSYAPQANENMEPIRIKIVPLLDDEYADKLFCKTSGATVNLDRPQTCTETSILTYSKKNYLLNTVLPQAEEWFNRVLSVYPVASLKLSYPQCGYVEAPTGTDAAPGSDFILFVTAAPTSGGTIAWALTCQIDESGRPIAGQANFGPNMMDLEPSQLDYQLSVAIHEIAHALGFSSSMFKHFRNPDGSKMGESNVVRTFNERGHQVAKIVTPKVIEKLRDQFDCQGTWTNAGGELEDYGGSGTAGSHWEKRLMRNEFMTGTASAGAVYSALSLALFEDSGWYKVNYNSAETLLWGYKEGCGFLKDRCSSWSDRYFCREKRAQKCTHDYLYKGYCNKATYQGSVPSHFQYFTDASEGGSDPHADYCPFVTSYSNGDCRESDTFKGSLETLGSMSRCFDSDDGPLCLIHGCGDDGIIKVTYEGQQIQCPSNGGEIILGSSQLKVYCPPSYTHCPTPYHNCPNECSNHGACDSSQSPPKCLCEAGWSGDDCSVRTCSMSNTCYCPAMCSGNGNCDLGSGTCACDNGWTGNDCSGATDGTTTDAPLAVCGDDCKEIFRKINEVRRENGLPALCMNTALQSVAGSHLLESEKTTTEQAAYLGYAALGLEEFDISHTESENKALHLLTALAQNPKGQAALLSDKYLNVAIGVFEPTAGKHQYFLIFALQNSASGCDFDVEGSAPLADIDFGQHVEMEFNTALENQQIQPKTYSYYRIYIDKSTDVTVSLETDNTDPDIFISVYAGSPKVVYPTRSSYRWKSDNGGSENEVINIPSTDIEVGESLLISIYQYDAINTASFKLLASRAEVCPDECNAALTPSRGKCESGACVCNEGFSGLDCGALSCPSVPGEPPCSGTGYCDMVEGVVQCICDADFEGEMCEKPKKGEMVVKEADGQATTHTVPPDNWGHFKFTVEEGGSIVISATMVNPDADMLLFLSNDAPASFTSFDSYDAEGWYFQRLTHRVSTRVARGQSVFVGVYNYAMYSNADLSFSIRAYSIPIGYAITTDTQTEANVTVSETRCPGSPLPCSNHGVCSSIENGYGKCECFTGFQGDDCGDAVVDMKVSEKDKLEVRTLNIAVGEYSFIRIDVNETYTQAGAENPVLSVEFENTVEGTKAAMVMGKDRMPSIVDYDAADTASWFDDADTNRKIDLWMYEGVGAYFVAVYNHPSSQAKVVGGLKVKVTQASGACPGDCGGHGQCETNQVDFSSAAVVSMCKCFVGFIGDDCREVDIPPPTKDVFTSQNIIQLAPNADISLQVPEFEYRYLLVSGEQGSDLALKLDSENENHDFFVSEDRFPKSVFDFVSKAEGSTLLSKKLSPTDRVFVAAFGQNGLGVIDAEAQFSDVGNSGPTTIVVILGVVVGILAIGLVVALVAYKRKGGGGGPSRGLIVS